VGGFKDKFQFIPILWLYWGMVNTIKYNISPGRTFSGVLSTIVLTFDFRPGIIIRGIK
tara:strand:+ start:290 stop:463 length:174 start_codon:yes stop_codon:yes gene_type:complete